VAITVSPIILDNKTIGAVEVFRDITREEKEKNSLAEQKAKDEAMLSSIGDGVIAVDQDEKIILVNPQAENLLGFKKEELLNRRFIDTLQLVDEEDVAIPSAERPIQKVFDTNKKNTSRDLYYIRKNKTKLSVVITSAPIILNGTTVGAINVFRDITKEKEIDKAKTEFVSLASHQLRTPLSAVNWYSEMLINGDVGKLTQDQLKYMGEIYKGNQRMVDLVNALLDVSRIELGTFAIDPEKVNIIDLTKDIVKEIKHTADEKKILLKEDYGKNFPEILIDAKLFQIIIQNLLSNAVKYTPAKGTVTLTMSDRYPNIIIEVKDNGYGIPEAQKPQIFTKLFRADNVRAKDTEGTGLGLYIVKAIVERSGGKIWFESEENKGTTFFIELPKEGMPKKEGTRALEDIK
jgi:PAS domain S-box-containing protein